MSVSAKVRNPDLDEDKQTGSQLQALLFPFRIMEKRFVLWFKHANHHPECHFRKHGLDYVIIYFF